MDRKKISLFDFNREYEKDFRISESDANAIGLFFWFSFLFFVLLVSGPLYIMLIPIVMIILAVRVINKDIKKKNKFSQLYGLTRNQVEQIKDFLMLEQCIIPIIQRLCMMNPKGKQQQINAIKFWYDIEESIVERLFFEEDYNEHFDRCVQTLRPNMISEWEELKSFINKLVYLAILEDGIHNDEWRFLLDLMNQLGFDDNYIDFFIKRYTPLRTEFEDWERKQSESSKKYHEDYNVNPYYAILGLEESASDEEVRKAYHALALVHHPDLPKNANRIKECEEMMAKINEAYEKIKG